jgi:hypothetical protein
MLGHSIVSQHFMELEGSIPNSQELSTCSYPEPDQSSPHHPIPPLQDRFLYRPLLWSSGQSSWLQIRRPWFDSRHYQEKNVVDLERGPLSLVSTTEELPDRKVAAPV